MVEFLEVAEFMDDEVVLRFGSKGDDFVVKVEVPFTRTAPPPGALIFDKYFVV